MTPHVIAGNTRSNLRTAWFFAVLWNLVSAPMLVVVPQEIERNQLAALGLLFPLIGIGLLAWAVMTTLRWRRFGPSRFEMSAAATLGGHCSGTIHTRLALDEVRSIRVLFRLTCLERITRGGGKNRRTIENILWREEYTVPEGQVGFGAFGATIPVRFALPSDARETSVTGRSDGIVWVLAAEANIPGVDFKEDFDVPVGRGESTSPEPARTEAFAPMREAISTIDLAQSGIHLNPTAHGTEYFFEAARNRGFAAGTTLFLLLWTGFLWLEYVLEAPWIFIVVTAFFELLILLIVSELWFGSTTVSIGSESVRRRVGMFGTGATRVIPAPSIKKLDLHISMQSTGRSGTPYYEIRATLDTGKHKHLGNGIRNKRHAEWVADRMRAEIGMQ